MNKKSKSLIAVYGILAIIVTIAFILIPFPKNAANIISFIFTVISAALSLMTIMQLFKKDESLKSRFYGFPVLKILLLYPLAQFALCAVICIISVFVAIPYWISLVLSLVIFGISAIGVIAADNTRDIIEENEAEIERVTKQTKIFNLNISSVLDLCKNVELKKEIGKLAEDFRFSDPVSCNATEEIENRISEKLEILKQTINSSDTDETKEKISELKNMLSERNRICKANK